MAFRCVQFVLMMSLALTLSMLPGGCGPVEPDARPPRTASNPGGIRLEAVDLHDLAPASVRAGAIDLSGAKNEWMSFTLEVRNLPATNGKRSHQLRIGALSHGDSGASLGTEHVRAYQVLSMPIDVNRAGYVRHTGLSATSRTLPRALLPLPVNEGKINLTALRDPRDPTNPQSRAGGSDPVLLWIDLHIPPEAPAGSYTTSAEVVESGSARPVAVLPVSFTVYDFVLPDERHLNIVGQLEWDSLQRLFPDRFEAITDRLLNRTDPRYAEAVRTLDQLMVLAQAHRTQLIVPRLQPTVKWPGGRPPQVTWDDYDSVVAPWLTGSMFADRIPLGYWPLPAVNGLFNYDLKSQTEYWAQAASHFDQKDWLNRASVFLEKTTPGRANTRESLTISADAAAILACHPRIRVCAPIEDDQIRFATAGNPKLVATESTGRLITANPGIVFTTPMEHWPKGVARPPRWLRTDLTGLVPYVGAGGDERDARLWAWLASIPLPPPPLGGEYGPVQFIRWLGVLPRTSDARQPADPNELVWFYPGSWFGVSEPVPTIQLKWLRQAQQDFEYLYLAKQRGDRLNAIYMARLITRPVELQPAQEPDPTYGLMSGTADPRAWIEAKNLLAKRILLREPGQPVSEQKKRALDLQMLRWSEPQERPVIMGRSTLWSWDQLAGPPVSLRLGIDVYNASDSTPDDNTLEYSPPMPTGWQVQPHATRIPTLGTYHVRRFWIDAHVDPNRVRNIDRIPVQITFTNGFSKRTSILRLILPVSTTDRREGKLNIDGTLEDWSPDDLVHDGPLVRMLDRPALQAQRLEPASGNSSIYSGWADENFYLAFKVAGLSQPESRAVRNFLSYQFRRAWGEDLCQIIIQPVYADNSLGPIMHVVCKPNGHWVERKMDPKAFAEPWQAFEGTGVRYAATIDADAWRGEVAIPWKAINDLHKGMPVMLRFNFTQHHGATGESASWAGPVDFGRDDSLTGILFLRDVAPPGVAGR